MYIERSQRGGERSLRSSRCTSPKISALVNMELFYALFEMTSGHGSYVARFKTTLDEASVLQWLVRYSYFEGHDPQTQEGGGYGIWS